MKYLHIWKSFIKLAPSMYKNQPHEYDFTAEFLGQVSHRGSGIVQKIKKKFEEKRGRKPKEGRSVYSFKINLLPTHLQQELLQKDLDFFTAMYDYTTLRLQEPFCKNDSDIIYGYDVVNRRKTTAFKPADNIVPHTPKFVMNSQNAVIKESAWMKACTYQVSYRATVQAFKDFTDPSIKQGIKKSIFDGNTYEAKICYRLINGLLYLKKYDQTIQIKETLPKGSLESIRITRNADDTWSAIIEILEPYDKGNDIVENKEGYLPTDTKEYKLNTTVRESQILFEKLWMFKNIVQETAIGDLKGGELSHKIRGAQFRFGKKEANLGLINMACVAAVAKTKRASRRKKPFTTLNTFNSYLAISEGFYFDKGLLHLPRWKLTIDMKTSPELGKKWFDYIILKRDIFGKWTVSAKKQKKYIVRNFCRIYNEFSHRWDI